MSSRFTDHTAIMVSANVSEVKAVMYETNQQWAYAASPGYEASRIIIGAIVSWG